MEELFRRLFGITGGIQDQSVAQAFPLGQGQVDIAPISAGDMPIAQPVVPQNVPQQGFSASQFLPSMDAMRNRLPSMESLRGAIPTFAGLEGRINEAITPQLPAYMQGLLGANEAAALPEQARRAGLMNAAAALMQASGPQDRRISLGQALGAGLQGFQQGSQGAFDQTLQGLKLRAELAPKPTKLTGEYANLALGLYKTDDPNKLSAAQFNNVIAQVNKEAALRGGIGGDVALGKSATGKVDDALLTSGSRLQTLSRINQAYDPKFLETKFRVGMATRAIGEKLGRELSDTERNDLTAYSTFRQDSVRQLNQYINEITGAAIGQGEEAARLKSGVPNPGSGLFDGDSPTEFNAKLKNTIKDLKMAEARLHYIKVNGLKLDDVSLGRMPTIMKNREQELIKQFNLDPTKLADRNVLKARLSQEFGLLQ